MAKSSGKMTHVQLVDIHGARFFDLRFVLDGSPERERASRIGAESVYPDPEPGDRAVFDLLLGQLTNVEKSDG